MQLQVQVKNTGKFKQLYDLPPDTSIVLLIGGRGGMKTYEGSKFCAVSAVSMKKRIAILRDEKEPIRQSILNEIFMRYDTANKDGVLDDAFEKTETGIKDRESGKWLVYTKGFRASTVANKTHLKGISDTDIALIEEAEDIRDVTKFNTFSDSIREEGAIIVIITNVPDMGHWIVKRFFKLEPAPIPAHIPEGEKKKFEGFFKLIPKEIPGVVVIQTTYQDNKYLPLKKVKEYEDYGNPESERYDPFHFMTDILGYTSSGRKGQIFTKVKRISLTDYLKLPYREVYGQDFGTASPAGLVGAKIHRNTVWARQLNYEPMEDLEIAKLYCSLRFTQSDRIIADSADDKACTRLEKGWQGHELSDEDFSKYPGLRNGFNIVRARKGPDSITFGISLLKGMNVYVVDESEDFWNEIYNYIYAKDKYENYTNDPVDDFNHLIDPLRYIVLDHDLGSDGGGIERVN